jgi:hypothetical protein
VSIQSESQKERTMQVQMPVCERAFSPSQKVVLGFFIRKANSQSSAQRQKREDNVRFVQFQ